MRKSYVYLHRRMSDSKIFYVGKGVNNRCYEIRNRNEYWKKIADKHGAYVQIVSYDMHDKCAQTLEKILIAIIGRENLSNATNGGEGCHGRIMGEAQRNRASKMLKGISPKRVVIEAAKKANKKPIGTRCGLIFESLNKAAEFIKPNNYNAAKSAISSSATGKTKTSFGYEWGYIENGFPKFLYVKSLAKNKAVRTLCGLEFESLNAAARWIQVNGRPTANPTPIMRAARGEHSQAYGYRWEYA